MKAQERHAIRVIWLTIALYMIFMVFTGCGRARYRLVDNRSSVSVVMHPATPQQCPNGGTVIKVGTASTVVCNGLDGTDGVSIVGPPGPSGTPGTVVSFVNLCPGTTSYPSVFIEVAMCVSNKLYAVYSANNGFLVYLPPGNYSSNAIGSACNLTVKPNCVVSH